MADTTHNAKTQIDRTPTSQLLEAAIGSAHGDYVTAEWLLARLRSRSFGMIMFFLGLTAMLPGVSIVAGLLLIPLAFQMMIDRDAPVLFRAIALKKISTRRISQLLARAIPVISALEAFIRPRWPTPFGATKRIAGFVVLLLGITLLPPIPFSNVIPGAAVMLVAFAYIEEDGALLCIALLAAIASLAVTGLEGWAALNGAGFLFRL